VFAISTFVHCDDSANGGRTPQLHLEAVKGSEHLPRQTVESQPAQPTEVQMPRGDKSKYTGKQERKADHIAEGYEKRGVSEKEVERRAWATVNKDDGGGKKEGGSGRGKSTGHPAAHKGGRMGGKASASRSAASRSASAKKAAATRKRNHGHAGS
jgi:plasmid stabilization system protein ParE